MRLLENVTASGLPFNCRPDWLRASIFGVLWRKDRENTSIVREGIGKLVSEGASDGPLLAPSEWLMN